MVSPIIDKFLLFGNCLDKQSSLLGICKSIMHIHIVHAWPVVAQREHPRDLFVNLDGVEHHQRAPERPDGAGTVAVDPAERIARRTSGKLP